MVNNIILGAAVKSTLTSIQKSRESVDKTAERLATGLKVNRATDQPQNFLRASALTATANNYNTLLDKMAIGVRTIQQASAGVEAIENILRPNGSNPGASNTSETDHYMQGSTQSVR